jgi:hypothetical protein
MALPRRRKDRRLIADPRNAKFSTLSVLPSLVSPKMESVLPSLTKDRKLIAEPIVTKSSTLRHDPSVFIA